MNAPLRTTAARLARLAALCVPLLVALCAGDAGAQALVDISNTPLYGGLQAHPNVVVTTSVEFPTVGAAYLNVGYTRQNPYVGYFDNTKCYTYSTASGGYFAPSGNADTNHECSGAFSGNFMNWATMSAIDEFRYAMTGGNRDNETGPNNGTIIMRAYLPDGAVNGVPSYYALDSNFPRLYINNGSTGSTANAATNVAGTYASAVLPIAGFDSSAIYITSCRTQVFFSTSNGGDCNSPAQDKGAYNVRINVCDATEGPVRTDLCLQYGGTSGSYKPVGQTQVNANSMRFAVFGYLMDHNTSDGYTVPSGCDDGSSWNRCRYGGVLRAPMKYVGPIAYTPALVPSPNAKAEINADGTLIADPELTAASAGGTKSGFINYINNFGATGVYKRYDPAGELFYEAIRYYQGPANITGYGPTPQAISGTLTPQVKDHFPFESTWTDPIGSICSANYIINVSDANTWDDSYLPGFNGSPSVGYGRPASRPVEGGLDTVYWTHQIGVLESTTSSLTTDDVRPNLAGLENQHTGGTGTSLQLVAGAAYWANITDVRPDLPGKQSIKTISVDVAEASTDIHDRSLYLMGKYGGFTDDHSPITSSNPFFTPDLTARTNAKWQDSTGLPANYLLASSPQKLINGLRAAFAQINAQTGTLSGAALTSANLTYGAAGAYIATFNPAKWSGSVLFNSISVDPMTGNLLVSTAPLWDAGALLTARCGTVSSASTTCTDTDTSTNKRDIVTVATVAGVRTAVPFTWTAINGADPAGYAASLNRNPTTGVTDSLGPQRVNYLRGYRGDEASTLQLRPRDSAMGDIVNSGPVYAGPPTSAIPDTDYQAFYIANAARTPAVYAGANDGMMHALRASDGFELFAYIPGFSYPDLGSLTDPGYQHKVFVDTVPKVQEVKVGSAWKTVLLGANGNGVQGIFALDVTDPATFGPGNVLFEFSDADDPDFGSVTATPEFAKLWVSGTAAAPVYRYFAVVTGYNDARTTVNGRADAHVTADTQNQGVLFLIALDHTLGTAWTQNVDYYKFKFPATNPALPNGLAPVTLLASATGDRSTGAMYFGDLQGNLWKFNTGTGDPTTWASALGTASLPTPIFVAHDDAMPTANRQPITARVELANGPYGGTFVFFGTGRYFGATDLALPGAVESEYALLDLNPSVLISRDADLVSRSASVTTCPAPATGTCLAVSGSAFSYSGTSAKKGWYLDFPYSASQGERSVTKPAIRTGLLTFTTLTLSSDLCTPGNGFVYQVSALTGLQDGAVNVIGYSSTVGIPGPPRVVDLTLTSGTSQASGEVINLKTQTTLVSGTAGKIGNYGSQTPTKVPPTQQINWREITNWNDKTGH